MSNYKVSRNVKKVHCEYLFRNSVDHDFATSPYCNNIYDDVSTLRRVQKKFIALQISHRIVY